MVEQEHLAEQIMRALKDPGVSLVIRPDDIRFQDGDPAEPEDSGQSSHPHRGSLGGAQCGRRAGTEVEQPGPQGQEHHGDGQ